MLGNASLLNRRLLWFLLGSGLVWSVALFVVVDGPVWLTAAPLVLAATAAAVLGLVRVGQLFEALAGLWVSLVVVSLAAFLLAGDPSERLAAVPFGLVLVVPAATVLFLLVIGVPMIVDNRVRERELL